MSVVFYKKGTDKLINNLLCDICLVAPELFNGTNVPEGWFLSPEAAHMPIKDESEEVDNGLQIETETKEEKTEETKVLKGNAKIRNDAKEAGIENWEKARISTLEQKLKA